MINSSKVSQKSYNYQCIFTVAIFFWQYDGECWRQNGDRENSYIQDKTIKAEDIPAANVGGARWHYWIRSITLAILGFSPPCHPA